MNTLLSLLDTQVVKLAINTHEMETADYRFIQVWRSTLGEGGPYERISGAGYLPAFLPTDFGVEAPLLEGALTAIQGKTLTFQLHDDTYYEFTFPGSVPLTFRECADALNAAFPSLIEAGLLSDGRFFLRTVRLGAQAGLRVVASDASVMLGLATEACYGLDSDVLLAEGTKAYSFTDPHGKATYYYRTRFADDSGSVVSAFAQPLRAGSRPTALAVDQLIIGYVKLVDVQGRVSPGVDLVVYVPFTAQRVGDRVVSGGVVRCTTDDDGYASVRLLRGALVDVGVAGTNLLQRVQVPTDALIEQFDLLDPAYADRDAFALQKVEQPFAVRRNL